MTCAAFVGLLLLAGGCDASSEGPTSTKRSEQVFASAAPSPSPATAPTASAPPHAAAPRAHKLCEGDGDAKGRSVPKLTAAHVESAGATPVDGALPPPRGRYTWLNLWAAWCGPCKEEMGRLTAWQDKLTKAGANVRFVFVSLDDDRRQVQDFLDHQPDTGLKSSLWLPEGPGRSALLAGLGGKASLELPQQVLLDPNGKVRCYVQGAVEDGDYAEIAELVSR